jgi:hypothetical protein
MMLVTMIWLLETTLLSNDEGNRRLCLCNITRSYHRYLTILTAFWVLSAIYGPCSIWIAWQRSSPMKGELRWRGPNSISKFDHHNINGGAVDYTWRQRWSTCKLNLIMRYLWVLLEVVELLNEAVSLDFLLLFFFHKSTPPRPLVNTLNYYNSRRYSAANCRKIDSALCNIAWSQIFSSDSPIPVTSFY